MHHRVQLLLLQWYGEVESGPGELRQVVVRSLKVLEGDAILGQDTLVCQCEGVNDVSDKLWGELDSIPVNVHDPQWDLVEEGGSNLHGTPGTAEHVAGQHDQELASVLHGKTQIVQIVQLVYIQENVEIGAHVEKRLEMSSGQCSCCFVVREEDVVVGGLPEVEGGFHNHNPEEKQEDENEHTNDAPPYHSTINDFVRKEAEKEEHHGLNDSDERIHEVQHFKSIALRLGLATEPQHKGR
mmetsp:Transcript_14192/g.33726  ORF Transcript_14192/g.33726 Transcript_14192/m.33726 type:complete len:240 (-) Transcript_14192:517-1236(-)